MGDNSKFYSPDFFQDKIYALIQTTEILVGIELTNSLILSYLVLLTVCLFPISLSSLLCMPLLTSHHSFIHTLKTSIHLKQNDD